MEKGMKFDGEKLRTDLYPIDAFLETCKVLTYGAKKYAPRNWEKGFEWSRAYGALLRHLFAFWQGEELDPETGIHHLAHAHCELIFLQCFQMRHVGQDDRPLYLGEGWPTDMVVKDVKHMPTHWRLGDPVPEEGGNT